MKDFLFEVGSKYWFEKRGVVVIYHGKNQFGHPIFEYASENRQGNLRGNCFSAGPLWLGWIEPPVAIPWDFDPHKRS